ncbi:hypothetical protein EAG_00798 [Camponotus floridanus]|uniref:Uncharacterized protein n=1 Tax=Camponotus floridanus TaxID=104421 RepID=E2AQN1_CAMFO|nr:hypothetical protein EAG_00798 [Camponotus floridanus]
MTPPYVPLQAIQLLSETFFCSWRSLGEIWIHRLKWDTLGTSDTPFASTRYFVNATFAAHARKSHPAYHHCLDALVVPALILGRRFPYLANHSGGARLRKYANIQQAQNEKHDDIAEFINKEEELVVQINFDRGQECSFRNINCVAETRTCTKAFRTSRSFEKTCMNEKAIKWEYDPISGTRVRRIPRDQSGIERYRQIAKDCVKARPPFLCFGYRHTLPLTDILVQVLIDHETSENSDYFIASIVLSMYRVLHLNTWQYDGLPIPSESDWSRNTRADIIDECVRGLNRTSGRAVYGAKPTSQYFNSIKERNEKYINIDKARETRIETMRCPAPYIAVFLTLSRSSAERERRLTDTTRCPACVNARFACVSVTSVSVNTSIAGHHSCRCVYVGQAAKEKVGLTRGKNMDRPKMNRFLEELRFTYCNVDRPNEELN